MKEMDELKKQFTNQSQQISSLQTEVYITKHVETGQVKCGNSDTWNKVGYLIKLKKNLIRFQKDYPRPPVVFLSITHLDRDNADLIYTEYYTELLSVNSTSFEMQCKTYYDPKWRVIDMWVSWISIGN